MNYRTLFFLCMSTLSTYAMENEPPPLEFLLREDFSPKTMRRSASTLKEADKYLKFLENEFLLEHQHPRHRIIQFQQLVEYLAFYLKYSTFDNKEGECRDDQHIHELKKRIQDRGFRAYFDQGKYFKKRAIKLFSEANQVQSEEQKSEKYMCALKAAHRALKDFETACRIEKRNQRARACHEEMESYCTTIENALHALPQA